MKKFITSAMLAAFSVAIVGCEASMKAGDPDKNMSTGNSSYEKKTVTTQAPNGDTTTHTEMNKTN